MTSPAKPATDAGAKPEPVTAARRTRTRVAGLGIAQVIGVEVVLAALLFVPGVPLPWLGGVAAAVALLGLGRTHGRSWFGWLGHWLRWRSRVRADRRDRRSGGEPGPRPRLATIAERGTEIGVAFDGTGWFAAVKLEGEAPPSEVFAAVTGLLNAADTPVTSVQLVTRSGAEVGRDNWFAVRLDVPGAHAVAADRGGGALGVHRALGGAVSRLLKGAQDAGIDMRALSQTQLAAALRFSLDLHRPDSGEPTESWKTWRNGGMAQTTYWLRGRRSAATEVERLWTKLSELDKGTHAISLALRPASSRPGDKRLMFRCLVRLVDEASNVEELGRELTKLTRKNRLKLLRCNGTQGPASYASALSGGAW
ncbi:type VII secretion protein EccE [Stackebrandtia nassauensis]|uniref:Type VII secretion system protein EccE domain-containing protein n=1 Tax=Stackebrandtia nassauensis (strain DSM 44728 / CIP 108903 / NRRL B-16338 / NBRC 102104 / LLR-40K-21) TaxID=446470 RepID=D3Q4F4_STANL|nr:type VII secretion protein EccE [Stackebrandtia nassauensis]ADD40114.1 hypothetical protein Snas_0397 [Stackebrandtia nassauensis DSM 44728]